MRPQHINVIFIYAADMEAMKQFYAHTLGFGEPLHDSADWVEFALEQGTHLALHHATPEALKNADPSRNTIQFSVVIDDLLGAYDELKAGGVTFTRTPEKGYHFKLAELTDPEGNPGRLIEFDG